MTLTYKFILNFQALTKIRLVSSNPRSFVSNFFQNYSSRKNRGL